MTNICNGLAAQAQPLTLPELSQFHQRLKSAQAVQAFRQAALDLLNQAGYQDWLAVQRYKGLLFRIEANLPGMSVLADLGLVGEGEYLRVQIHQYRGKLFVTDSPNVAGAIQVYPWDDESDAIVGWVSQHWPGWAEYSVDPMCGAGHHNIVMPGALSRASFDLNPRAVCFTDVNALLNGVSVCARVNDIRSGFADALVQTGAGKDARILLMINTPFALSPVQGVLPVHSDGGETGAVLARAAMDAARDFSETYSNVRICQLVYTIGNPTLNSWYVVDHARARFGAKRVGFDLLSERKLWRVNGRKEEANPMPLANLRSKAFCAFQVKGTLERREEMAEGYDRLADRLLKEFNATHLGYGIVNIDLT